VLERVARILEERCRETDVVARYGGEEFLLCFPEANSAAVAAICEELRRSVEAADWSELVLDLRRRYPIDITFETEPFDE
jgi:diguanylate cyclase (GGDEF)-like protein